MKNCPTDSKGPNIFLEHGMIDLVTHRRELRDKIIQITDLLTRRHSEKIIPMPTFDNGTGSTNEREAAE